MANATSTLSATCNTCGIGIDKAVNGGNFGFGDCKHCEYRLYLYCKQSLEVCERALDHMLELDHAMGGSFDPYMENAIHSLQALIKKARGKQS